MTGNMRQARDPDTGWSFCFFDPRAKIEIFERPWPKSTVFPRGYICNSINLVFLPYVFNSIEREVGNHFSAERMAALDDPDSPDFESTFEFIKAPIIRKEVRRKNVKLPLRRTVPPFRRYTYPVPNVSPHRHHKQRGSLRYGVSPVDRLVIEVFSGNHLP
ncbi:conserved hypothetical protein [Culex quinquefasciatus]|uniref:Uncharacterized protein n=1 Tax=Culex quinquefasciatus TaxID=7176 RepID=B0XKE5_CULQU|nr:conserved hypothetical protein [Culex quinquefasciatus]|eukprot:XP_001870117.1 conserved hypothetical protein [Culex quinquefasciatus]